MVRKKTEAAPQKGADYYFENERGVTFFSSGCNLLNLALSGKGIGGGWALGRVVNIVGDKSTGKTLLAIEATVNFAKEFPDGLIFYNEVEAAFDKPYAEALGMPMDRVKFSDPCFTVEDLFADIEKVLNSLSKNQPCLYVIDSLDALSDKAELERKFEDTTMGAQKAKKMSELFRRLNQLMEQKNLTLMVISQIRDKIGVSFGEKHERTGGKALDFYASQVCYLAHIKTNTRQYRGVTRATGVEIKAKVKKNKVALPFREAEFSIEFGYGIDDVNASIAFLIATKSTDGVTSHYQTTHIELTKLDDRGQATRFFNDIMPSLSDDDLRVAVDRIQTTTDKVWAEIEQELVPARKKY